MSIFRGTDAAETLSGSSGGDSIFGYAGDDRILTMDGIDYVEAGDGHDEINGYKSGPSDFAYWSFAGAKTILAGHGNDFAYGGSGNDSLYGGDGNDELHGGGGQDFFDGGAGNDEIFGGPDKDTIDGGIGVDGLYGEAGDDTYHVRSTTQYIYDTAGTDTAYVYASHVKLPSSLENVVYLNGAQALPYWISALLPDESAGLRYAHLLGAGQQFAYSFPSTIPSHYASDVEDASGWAPFTTLQQTQAESALAYISTIVSLGFVKTTEASGLNTITFANNSQASSAGYARLPDDSAAGSDLFLDNSDASENASISDGTYAAYTLIHELGHTLGLKHPFAAVDSSGHASDPPWLPSTENAVQWTVMSYESSSSDYHLRLSPLDIAALQYLYGPSKTARTGNDTYAISSTGTNLIWDGAGDDTLSAAACAQGCTVYLTPGEWGYVGASRASTISSAGQITVNFGTTIENLTGSAFADHLHGNDAGNLIDAGEGHDWIEGGAGDDTLVGGAGNDTAGYALGAGNYVLTLSASGTQLSAKSGVEGTDSLSGVEQLQFSDKTVNIAASAHGSYADLPDGLTQFFVTAFGGAPGVTYMDQLAEAYRWYNGRVEQPVKTIVEIFTSKSQFTDVYPSSLTSDALASRLVDRIVKTSAGTTAKNQAAADVQWCLEHGWTTADVIYTVFGNLARMSQSDAEWGQTAAQFSRQVVVAKYYTDTLSQSTTDLETLRDVMEVVTPATDVSSGAVVADLIGVALLNGGVL